MPGAGLVRLARDHFRLLAVLTALGCGSLFAFLIRTGWFAEDDFSNLSVAKRMGLTVEFLFKPIFGTRLSPGHRLVDWLALQWPGHEWAVVVAISAACLAGSTFLAAVLVRQLTGSALAALGAAILFGTWVGWVRIGLWWPTAAHTLPAVLLMLASITLAVSWSRSRSGPMLVGVILAAGGALMFSSRASLTPLIIAVLLVLGGPGDRSISLRKAGRRLGRAWPPIVGTLAVSVVFVYFESRTPGFRDRAPSPNLDVWLDYMRIWVIDAQASFALNRVPSPAQGLFTRTIPGLIVIAALAAATIRGSRSACVWLAALVLVLLCGLQVGWARLGQLGTGMGFDPRYHEGDIIVAIALIPCAWSAAGLPSPTNRRQAVWLLVAVAAILVAWIASLGVGAKRIRSEPPPSLSNPGAVPKATFQTLKRTLPDALRGAKSPTLVNSTFPLGLSQMKGTDIREVLAVFLPDYEFTRWEPGGTPILIGDDGVAQRLEQARSVPVRGGRRNCLKTQAGSEWLGKGSAGLELPLPEAGNGTTRVLEFQLTQTAGTGELAIAFQPSENENYPEVQLPVSARRDGVLVAVPPLATSAKVAAWGGLSTCLTGAQVSYSPS